jgi:hypothetical protein
MTNIIALGFCSYFALLIILFFVKNFVLNNNETLNLSE